MTELFRRSSGDVDFSISARSLISFSLSKSNQGRTFCLSHTHHIATQDKMPCPLVAHIPPRHTTWFLDAQGNGIQWEEHVLSESQMGIWPKTSNTWFLFTSLTVPPLSLARSPEEWPRKLLPLLSWPCLQVSVHNSWEPEALGHIFLLQGSKTHWPDRCQFSTLGETLWLEFCGTDLWSTREI